MMTAGGPPGPTAANVQTPHFAPAGGSGAAAPAGGAPGAAAAPGQANLSAAAEAAVRARGTPATLNLDDIFGDCFFTPEGDTVFLGDQPAEVRQAVVSSAEAPGGVASVASRAAAAQPAAAAAAPRYVPVPLAGGIATTGLDRPGAAATVMGSAPGTAVPAPAAPAAAAAAPAAPPASVGFAQPPQRRHHLPFATPAMTAAVNAAQATTSKRKTDAAAARERKMSDKQKVERRERNREHAKRSRIRKKFLLESLQQSVSLLKEENDKLRGSIRAHLPEEADELLKAENLAEAAAAAGGGGLIANSSSDANKVLDDPDFSFIKALQTAQQNFVVTDPSLPDNPIVYATQGFLNLTGYTLDQVLGRNCRFLQGPETDPKAVEKIRRAIEDGTDMSVCLLNYRVDGTTFWNQFFIAALRDAAGSITNYVGVQCKVSDQYAANVCRRQEEAEQADSEAEAAEGEAGEGQAPVAMDTDMGSSAVASTAAMATVAAPAAPVPTHMAPPQAAPVPAPGASAPLPAAVAPAPVPMQAPAPVASAPASVPPAAAAPPAPPAPPAQG